MSGGREKTIDQLNFSQTSTININLSKLLWKAARAGPDLVASSAHQQDQRISSMDSSTHFWGIRNHFWVCRELWGPRFAKKVALNCD